MRIAICDDENIYINLIEDYVEKCKPPNAEFDCDALYSGEELIDVYKKSQELPYDLLFLDMEMSELNGIETAKQIRKYDKNVIIIFVTSHNSYVYDCFDVNPTRFLVKPIDFEKFKEAINTAYSKYINSDKVFSFTSNRNKIMLHSNDILYFESNRRKMIIHTQTQKHEIYATLNEIYEIVQNSTFAYPHNSFVINMEHISAMNAESIEMSNGVEIPISKKYRKQFLNAYMAYTERSYNL